MCAALADLLVELSELKAFRRFQNDPKTVIAEAHLTEADLLALRSLFPMQTPTGFPTPASRSANPGKRGSLIVVGTGIAIGHLSTEARSWIETVDKVLYCVADAASERLIRKLNPNAESLVSFYGDDKRRSVTYEQMVERTLAYVRSGLDVCMVFYGHPGIFVTPSHEAIKRANSEGFEAKMLPAVSSLDCLFADLGIDPATGCQMFEATDLLLRNRSIDTTTHVVIWQIGCVGDFGFRRDGFDGRNIAILAEFLGNQYGEGYEVTIYEAAKYNVCEPRKRSTTLRDLPSAGSTAISTLYLPPKTASAVNVSMARRLGVYEMIKAKMANRQGDLPEAGVQCAE